MYRNMPPNTSTSWPEMALLLAAEERAAFLTLLHFRFTRYIGILDVTIGAATNVQHPLLGYVNGFRSPKATNSDLVSHSFDEVISRNQPAKLPGIPANIFKRPRFHPFHFFSAVLSASAR
jgi:hypothetical protein